ncbi:hypothetical protein FRC12_010606 [Ceratobasidium sp. 428]|nr:hypothetical protein FRC12_010606 [Ceratobasidium sp. 428]
MMRLRTQELATQDLRLDISNLPESIAEVRSLVQNLLIPPVPILAPDHDLPEAKLPVIDMDLIESQEAEMSYTVIENEFYFIPGSAMRALRYSKGIVCVTVTTGLLGGVRVMRRSYNSPSPAMATQVGGQRQTLTPHQLAKRTVVSLSKYHHPNLACLKGVARDLDGQIREIVFTTAPMTQQQFLERAGDPAAVARYMKGMVQIHELERMDRQTYRWTDNEVQIRVNYNGHVTAIPGTPTFGRYRSWPKPLFIESSPAADILEIFHTQFDQEYNNPQSDPAGLDRFTDGVSHLRLGFTPLDVLKVAASAAAVPTSSKWSFTATGPFLTTFSAGDFVVVEDSCGVKVLEKQSRELASFFYQQSAGGCGSRFGDTGGWLSVRSVSGICWSEKSELRSWQAFRTKAKQLSQSRNIPLHLIRQAV